MTRTYRHPEKALMPLEAAAIDRLLIQRRVLVLQGKNGKVEIHHCPRCGDLCVVCQEHHRCCLEQA